MNTTSDTKVVTDKEKVKILKRTKMRERQSFDFDWEDERQARKFIRPSMDDIRQRLKDDGVPTRFKKDLDKATGVQSYTIWCGREVEDKDKQGNKITVMHYHDWDYIAIHVDSQRKFPRPPTPKSDEDGGDKKKKGKRHYKMNMKVETSPK